MLDFIGLIFLVIIFVCAGLLYVRNIVKLITEIRLHDWSLIMISRIVGIFFPVWGIIMGLV